MSRTVIKIATPISHLFDNPENADIIMANSDCLECRERSLDAQFPGQELFHCGLQPNHELSRDDFDYLKKIRSTKPELKLITLHLASSCDAPRQVGNMFQPGGRQYSREAMLKNARGNIPKMRMILGNRIKIAVENNNYYPTEAYLYVTDADFIREIVYDNDIMVLFDMAHAKVTAHNKRLDYEVYKSGLPLDRTVQVHVCNPIVDENNLAVDAHNLPGDEELSEAISIVSDNHGVNYLTIEYYKDADNLVECLKHTRAMIDELS